MTNQSNVKAVSWCTIARAHWAGDFASKVHAFDARIDGLSAITICGREFDSRTDRDKLRRSAIYGHVFNEGIHVVETNADLTTIDCKQCLRTLTNGHLGHAQYRSLRRRP
jgi:hypothetical protein